MNIKRKIGNKAYEFKLTQEELYNAYTEQQFIFDKMDVLSLSEGMSDEELIDCYGVSRAVFENLAEDMASRMRRYIDKYDMEFYSARDDAARDVIASFLSESQTEDDCIHLNEGPAPDLQPI